MIRLAVSGRLQGLLDDLRGPYCCSGVAASAVAADKALCKLAMTGLGVATPRWRLADADGRSFARQCVQVMVKPRLGGSSVGMALARTGEELNEAISAATAIDPVGVTPAPGTAAVRGGAGRHGTAWPVWRAGAAPLGSITDAS